jgi:hypothetical protein
MCDEPESIRDVHFYRTLARIFKSLIVWWPHSFLVDNAGGGSAIQGTKAGWTHSATRRIASSSDSFPVSLP